MATRREVLYQRSGRQAEFQSGSWLIRYSPMSHHEGLRQRLASELVLKQLRRFDHPRLLVCNPSPPIPRSDLAPLTQAICRLHGESKQSLVDVVWDGDLFHQLPLEERLRLISEVEPHVPVGGCWLTVAKEHAQHERGLGSPLSAEEVVGYFCPAYQVVHEEHLCLGDDRRQRVVFTALVFVKRSPISDSQLDLDVHRSIAQVAAQRRAGH